MFKTKSKSKQVPLESLQIPQQFTLVQRSRGAPGLEVRGSGGSRAESRINPPQSRRSCGPIGRPGSSGESGVGEERSGDTPLPSHTFPVRSAPGGRGQGPRAGPVHPQAHPELQDSPGWILVLLPCAAEGGGETRASPLDPCPLLFKVEHRTGPGTPEWVRAAG